MVSCAIDKHVTVSVRKSPGATRITSDIVNYEGPTQDCPDRLLREALLYCGIQRGLTVHIESDVSPGSGLGSSSAVVIGIVTAVGALRLDREYLPAEIAEIACHIEIERAGRNIGKQDQYACAFGGLNRISFTKDTLPQVTPINVSDDFLIKLSHKLVLLNTNISRDADAILSSYSNKFQERASTPFKHMTELVRMVPEFESALESGNFLELAKLLNKSWDLKRSLSSSISHPYINKLISQAMDYGVFGKKLLGAGGGGHLLFLADEPVQGALYKLFGNLLSPVTISLKGVQLSYMAQTQESRTTAAHN